MTDEHTGRYAELTGRAYRFIQLLQPCFGYKETPKEVDELIRDLLAALDEMQGVVERCTKVTADGKRVGWGDKIYPLHPLEDIGSEIPDHGVLKCVIQDYWSGEEYDIEHEGLAVESNYSSPEAALAARKGE